MPHTRGMLQACPHLQRHAGAFSVRGTFDGLMDPVAQLRLCLSKCASCQNPQVCIVPRLAHLPALNRERPSLQTGGDWKLAHVDCCLPLIDQSLAHARQSKSIAESNYQRRSMLTYAIAEARLYRSPLGLALARFAVRALYQYGPCMPARPTAHLPQTCGAAGDQIALAPIRVGPCAP